MGSAGPELGAVLARWPVPHAAAAVVRRGGHVQLVGDAHRSFALASVTKLLSATAVLVAVQEGIVDLDEPMGPPGSTPRHLLSHASGLGPDGRQPLADPGARRIYANGGFELLGEVVARRAEMTFASYLYEAVCEPLGMGRTTLVGSPAHGARSDAADLARFAAEMLEPGTVLAPDLLDEATRPAFAALAGTLPGFGWRDPNPWGLGFELHDAKDPHWMPPTASPRAFGHFGRAGTIVWVDPDAGVSLVALTDRDFGPWAQRAWPDLGTQVLGE